MARNSLSASHTHFIRQGRRLDDVTQFIPPFAVWPFVADSTQTDIMTHCWRRLKECCCCSHLRVSVWLFYLHAKCRCFFFFSKAILVFGGFPRLVNGPFKQSKTITSWAWQIVPNPPPKTCFPFPHSDVCCAPSSPNDFLSSPLLLRTLFSLANIWVVGRPFSPGQSPTCPFPVYPSPSQYSRTFPGISYKLFSPADLPLCL